MWFSKSVYFWGIIRVESPCHTFYFFFSIKARGQWFLYWLRPLLCPHYYKRIPLTNVNLPFLVWSIFHGGLFQCSELMSHGSLDFVSLIGNLMEYYSWAFCFLKTLWFVFTCWCFLPESVPVVFFFCVCVCVCVFIYLILGVWPLTCSMLCVMLSPAALWISDVHQW